MKIVGIDSPRTKGARKRIRFVRNVNLKKIQKLVLKRLKIDSKKTRKTIVNLKDRKSCL